MNENNKYIKMVVIREKDSVEKYGWEKEKAYCTAGETLSRPLPYTLVFIITISFCIVKNPISIRPWLYENMKLFNEESSERDLEGW